MMKRKLTLRRSTIRVLSKTSFGWVAGGTKEYGEVVEVGDFLNMKSGGDCGASILSGRSLPSSIKSVGMSEVDLVKKY